MAIIRVTAVARRVLRFFIYYLWIRFCLCFIATIAATDINLLLKRDVSTFCEEKNSTNHKQGISLKLLVLLRFERHILVFNKFIHCFFEASSRFGGNIVEVLMNFGVLGVPVFAVLHVGLKIV